MLASTQMSIQAHALAPATLQEVFSEPNHNPDHPPLGRLWLERWTADGSDRAAVLYEAMALARQFLGQTAAPGNVLQLLEQTRERPLPDAEDERFGQLGETPAP